MDDQTKELYSKWQEEYKEPGSTPWPIVLLDINEKHNFKMYGHWDFKEMYWAYYNQGSIGCAEAYRLLAYQCYGYGNMSNNDRRRSGLAALKHVRR